MVAPHSQACQLSEALLVQWYWRIWDKDSAVCCRPPNSLCNPLFGDEAMAVLSWLRLQLEHWRANQVCKWPSPCNLVQNSWQHAREPSKALLDQNLIQSSTGSWAPGSGGRKIQRWALENQDKRSQARVLSHTWALWLERDDFTLEQTTIQSHCLANFMIDFVRQGHRDLQEVYFWHIVRITNWLGMTNFALLVHTGKQCLYLKFPGCRSGIWYHIAAKAPYFNLMLNTFLQCYIMRTSYNRQKGSKIRLGSSFFPLEQHSRGDLALGFLG